MRLRVERVARYGPTIEVLLVLPDAFPVEPRRVRRGPSVVEAPDRAARGRAGGCGD